MIKKTLVASLLLGNFASAYANNIVDEYQQQLMSSINYNESCYVNPANSSVSDQLSECESYWFFNLSGLDAEKRIAVTGDFLGIGISSSFVLVNKPLSENERVITAVDEFYAPMMVDLIDSSVDGLTNAPTVVEEIKSSARSRRSTVSGPETSSSTQPSTYSWKFRQVIPLKKTVFYDKRYDVAILEYEVEAFSRLPIYDELGNSKYGNPKYVRATLVGGTGISFNVDRRGLDYKEIRSTRKAPHQEMFYKYREYLNKVTISTKWNGVQAAVFDSFPKNNDRDRTGVTYNSSVQFGLGVSIPKLPINKLDFSSTKSLTFENGDFFDYTANTGMHKHHVTYSNKEFGSDYAKKTGYCELIGNAKGCWKYTSGINPPLPSFPLLYNTPYNNGFVPDYSVTYEVPRDTAGKSLFQITSSIEGMALQGYARAWFANLYYNGTGGSDGEDYKLNTYTKTLSLRIDWNNPIFTGAEPSIIRAAYGSDNIPQCLTALEGNSIAISECRPNTDEQLFIYTPDLQFVSISNDNKCLDSSSDVLELKPCVVYSNNSQSWYWGVNDSGVSASSNAVLYTEASDGMFKVLSPASSGAEGIKIMSTDSVLDAGNILPDSKFNTLKGRYKASAIVDVGATE
ncbi:hypothetical protein BIT28_23400 [Photobacterium proteolyticum]|uniref:Uncharacterized protein n=1 Tax=Photobacterium proteolyticum TaxID=1903952 RepID=A0A1Q9H233_9GAMM|nr:leukocidin family pore-forming toxin [Photobacterium proteolyticum]OLQ81827.1 hypothetical protein BIT28_23400 [Photobacterium proteolyticum]